MLIGGSTPKLGSTQTVGFDGYCATVHANPETVWGDLKCLLESAGYEVREVDCGKVRFYALARQLVDEKGHQLLLLKSGGSNPHPHLECFGSQAEVVARYLRENYSHQPTRIDHAIDLCGEKIFEHLYGHAVAICKQHGLRGAPAGDWVTPDGGRTFYVGSRSSQVFVRIYEKGIKYARDLGEPLTRELRGWVRCELELKPQTKVAKGLATQIEGPQMWGATGWTDQLAKEALGMQSEPVNIRERRESNTERALRFMGKQYAKHGAVLWKQCGQDYCEFGRALHELFGIEDGEAFDEWISKRFPDRK